MTAPADPKHSHRIDLGDLQILPENRSRSARCRGWPAAVLRGNRVAVCPLVFHGPHGSGKTRLVNAVLAALVNASCELTARSEPAGELARPDSEDDEAGFADRGFARATSS